MRFLHRQIVASLVGLSHWMACGRILEGWALVNESEVERRIELIREGVAAWRKAGARLWLPLLLALEAEAYAKGNRTEAALQMIEQAIAISEETGERWYLAGILRIKASLLSATDGSGDQVEILLASSLETARVQQGRRWELHRSGKAKAERRKQCNGCSRSTLNSPRAVIRQICSAPNRSSIA